MAINFNPQAVEHPPRWLEHVAFVGPLVDESVLCCIKRYRFDKRSLTVDLEKYMETAPLLEESGSVLSCRSST